MVPPSVDFPFRLLPPLAFFSALLARTSFSFFRTNQGLFSRAVFRSQHLVNRQPIILHRKVPFLSLKRFFLLTSSESKWIIPSLLLRVAGTFRWGDYLPFFDFLPSPPPLLLPFNGIYRRSFRGCHCSSLPIVGQT